MIIPVPEAAPNTVPGATLATPPEAAQAPVTPAGLCWSSLTPAAKGERLLAAAAEVFVTRGLDAPMSEVASAAGAGVASIYRRYPSKHELLAAIVVRRLDLIADAAAAAHARPGDRFEALAAMIRSVVEGQSVDDFMGEARAIVAGHPDIEAATARTTTAMERLLSAARAEGRLRSDATTLDVRLLFAATRAAKQVEPAQWPRMLELMLDALEARRPDPA